MVAAIVWFLSSAILVDLVGYWLHRWAHRKGSPLFRAHMTHHLVNYPPQHVLSDRYRSSKADNLGIWFAPFFVAYLIIILLVPKVDFWPAAAGAAVVAALNVVVHDLTHISGSIIWRSRLRGVAVRHHAHHFKMKKNFGILTDWWDRIFRTRREPGAFPARRRRPPL